jgi:hypothetical protein
LDFQEKQATVVAQKTDVEEERVVVDAIIQQVTPAGDGAQS